MTSDFFQDIGGTLQVAVFVDNGGVDYPDTPGYKKAGTSRAAARSASLYAGTLRDRVLAALTEYPMTADEVAEWLGKSILSIRPRFSELLALGKIKETNARRRNASGKSATVWRSVDPTK